MPAWAIVKPMGDRPVDLMLDLGSYGILLDIMARSQGMARNDALIVDDLDGAAERQAPLRIL